MAQAYNPTALQPYEPYVPPEPAPPPPSPIAPQNPPFQFTGAPISKGGAVAGVLDNIFRGYMNGKAQAAQNVANQFKAKTENLRSSHEQDVQRLQGLMRAGVSPDDPDFKKAVSSEQGSWGSMMEWQDKMVNGPDGGKKKKGKGKDAQPLPPAAVLSNPASTQQEKAEALHAVQVKAGSPISSEVKWYTSPEYQDQLKARQAGNEADLQGEQNRLTKEKAQATYDKYAGMSEDLFAKLPADRQQEFKNAKEILFPRKNTGATRLYELPDGTKDWFVPGEQPDGAKASEKTPEPKPAKINWAGSGEGRAMLDLVDHEGKTWTPDELAKGEGGAEIQALYKSGLKIQDESRKAAKDKAGQWYAHANYSDTLQTRRAIRSLGLKASAADIKEWSKREDMANAAEEIYQEASSVKVPTTTSDQKLLIQWVRSNNPASSRLPDSEIKRGLAAGDYTTRAQNAWDQATHGTLAPELHKDFLGDIRNSAQSNREEADKLKEDYGLDDDTLKAIAEAQGGKGGGKPGAGGKFDVTDPKGKVHHFDSQAQADDFKKLAGIK
jgi:hypothetical protein